MFFWFAILLFCKDITAYLLCFLLHDYCVYCRVFTSVFMHVFVSLQKNVLLITKNKRQSAGYSPVVTEFSI